MALNRILLGLVIALNLFLLGRVLFSDQGLFAYLDLKARYQELEQRIDGLDERNLELSREIRLLKADKAYLEKMIRQKMNFVREDEILYVFPEDGLEERSDDGPEGDPKNGGPDGAKTENPDSRTAIGDSRQ